MDKTLEKKLKQLESKREKLLNKKKDFLEKIDFEIELLDEELKPLENIRKLEEQMQAKIDAAQAKLLEKEKPHTVKFKGSDNQDYEIDTTELDTYLSNLESKLVSEKDSNLSKEEEN